MLLSQCVLQAVMLLSRCVLQAVMLLSRCVLQAVMLLSRCVLQAVMLLSQCHLQVVMILPLGSDPRNSGHPQHPSSHLQKYGLPRLDCPHHPLYST
ncbi:hypothetical protein GQ55_3G275500 [Panicum hallii var. hallii]|uniref:Uncharacterized protein n=1 Tax=Panicum hallii var. hallii TaxID=1504633 RepID=A0A2T7EDZ2_9POAL|nr:hypothetical protein GQ55_3G275500 [Panicum hallii var. hallii]